MLVNLSVIPEMYQQEIAELQNDDSKKPYLYLKEK